MPELSIYVHELRERWGTKQQKKGMGKTGHLRGSGSIYGYISHENKGTGGKIKKCQ